MQRETLLKESHVAGSRGQKRAPAAQRGRGEVAGLVRLGAFLAALPRAMVPTTVEIAVSR